MNKDKSVLLSGLFMRVYLVFALGRDDLLLLPDEESGKERHDESMATVSEHHGEQEGERDHREWH